MLFSLSVSNLFWFVVCLIVCMFKVEESVVIGFSSKDLFGCVRNELFWLLINMVCVFFFVFMLIMFVISWLMRIFVLIILFILLLRWIGFVIVISSVLVIVLLYVVVMICLFVLVVFLY